MVVNVCMDHVQMTGCVNALAPAVGDSDSCVASTEASGRCSNPIQGQAFIY